MRRAIASSSSVSPGSPMSETCPKGEDAPRLGGMGASTSASDPARSHWSNGCVATTLSETCEGSDQSARSWLSGRASIRRTAAPSKWLTYKLGSASRTTRANSNSPRDSSSAVNTWKTYAVKRCSSTTVTASESSLPPMRRARRAISSVADVHGGSSRTSTRASARAPATAAEALAASELPSLAVKVAGAALAVDASGRGCGRGGRTSNASSQESERAAWCTGLGSSVS
mmetsp:Transcript_38887/g.120197  ORF Transcript_38887/g.120197 Transcript_38887/m.120197 type:complete len:229 (+) Transcript_38887:318-1004(+)